MFLALPRGLRRSLLRPCVLSLGLGACRGDSAGPAPVMPPIVRVSINGPDSYTFATFGRSVTLSASVSVSTGGSRPVTWSSSLPSVATVDPAGLVTVSGNGTTLVVAAADGGADTVSVTVAQYAARLWGPSPPGPVAAGIPFSPVMVVVIDSGGAVVRNAVEDVTLALHDSSSGGRLSGELRRTTVEGIARFERLVIDAPGARYALTASTTSGAFSRVTSAPFAVLAGPDLLRFRNTAGDEVGALMDGEGAAFVNDLPSVRPDSIATAVFRRSPTSNDVVAFTRGRPPILLPNAPWTEGVDTLDLTFRAPIRIPVTVWMLVRRDDGMASWVGRAILKTATIWHEERMGVEFGDVTIVDASADPDAAGLRDVTACNQRSAAETLIGKTLGHVNVYYVDRVDGGFDRGYSCGPDVLFMGSNSGPDLLSHEFGHSFSLGHVDHLPDYGRSNVMHSASSIRQYLTEGQVFRSHFDPASAFSRTYNIALPAPRSCPGETTGLQCIALGTRLWADGTILANAPVAPPRVTDWLETSCLVGNADPDRALIAEGSALESVLLAANDDGLRGDRLRTIRERVLADRVSQRRLLARLPNGSPLRVLAASLPAANANDEIRQDMARAALAHRDAAIRGLAFARGARSLALLQRLAGDRASPLRATAQQALAQRRAAGR